MHIRILPQKLNKDQLDGLANLCFDLAKAFFIASLIPAAEFIRNPIVGMIGILMSFVAGLAFTYMALLLLYLKGKRL